MDRIPGGVIVSKIYYLDEKGVIRDAETYKKEEGWQELTSAELSDYFEQNISQSELIEKEHHWQQSQLTKTSASIVHYESDAKIPDIYSELRVTTYTEDDYYALLGDRKLLVEYVEQEDFPECGRPTLSGLVK